MKSDGTMSVTYEYDAWGNLISSSRNGSDAYGLYTLNVYTYRGYIYDIDTGFYYLQSRYYDPEVGRFLNADDTRYLGATGTTLGYNLYAYCENNSIVNVDYNGYWAEDYYGFKITQNGFNLYVHVNFLSRPFCLSYARDVIRQYGK